MNKNLEKLNIFISYSHKNMKYKEKFLTSLEALRQSYNIEPWHDGMIDAGGKIDDEVKKYLLKSQIILLIITDNFLASSYCMKIELEEAMKREKLGKCLVIPVIYQESVLSDNLSFFNKNRVPQDGKAIATGYANQSLGCTRAVNMIKTMIDNKFPYCKKDSSKIKKTSSKSTNNENKRNTKIESPVYIELYEEGKLSNINLNQNMVNLIPKYVNCIHVFRTMMDQSLLNAKKRYTKLYKADKTTTLSDTKRLDHLRLYLMDICAYTKTYITENVGIKVHFRVSKNNHYLGLIASTDDDNAMDLSADWTTKMTPIPMYRGLIYHSSKLGAPLIKSLNSKLNFKATHDGIWKDYITFTFPKLHAGQTPLISYGISIHKDYYKSKSDMLKILAYLNLGDIIEKYIMDYLNICKAMDKQYNFDNIINIL